MDFNCVAVREIIRETRDTISISFQPETTPDPYFDFLAGQHVTIKLKLDNQEFRRSYSLSSMPNERPLKITVKQVRHGLASTYLGEQLKAGDFLELSKPEGHFCIKPDPERRQNYFFFAAGSGITPVFSMIRTLLEHEPMSSVFLLYGSRKEEDIIFRHQLDAMLDKYDGQLFIEHTLSGIKKSLLPFLSPAKQVWTGSKGRISDAHIRKFLEVCPNRNLPASFYLCGPGKFIEETKSSLIHLQVDKKNIHAEYFTTPAAAKSASEPADEQTVKRISLTVHLNGKVSHLDIPGNKKVLDSLIEAGLDPPYSCSSGACSTCMAKLIEGQVKMDVALALEPEEIEQGYILTCQSRPVTDTLEIKF